MRRTTSPFAVAVLAAVAAACAGDTGTGTSVHIPQTDDRRVPTAELALPGDRTLRVTADEVVLRDDVEVTRRPSTDAPGRHVLTVTSDTTVLVHGDRPDDPVDGVLLHARAFDLPFERGEIVYADLPRDPAVVVPAGEPVAAAIVPAADVVCLEVFGTDTTWWIDGIPEPVLAGGTVRAELRASAGRLELACTDAPPTEPALDAASWAAERLGHGPRDDEGPAAARVRLTASLDRGTDLVELEARAGRSDTTIRWPRDPSTLVAFAGEGRWGPDPADEPEPLSGAVAGSDVGPSLDVADLRGRGAGVGVLEVCVLVEDAAASSPDEAGPTEVCTPVSGW
ncbi:hypothetical protein FTX61_15300 [Nitriliruptoraceae bacterium ZYF776]|nr:hypothetical protein [Profundirhabdus halotolerans]